MARTYLWTVTFNADTGLAADEVVNTWHFRDTTADIVDPNFGDAKNMLHNFYLATPAGATNNLGYYLGGSLGNLITYKAYNLGNPVPRVPDYTFVEDVGGGFTGARLPHEVALCMSYRGDYASGTPNARKRNRVYIGPLKTTAADDTTGRPAAAFVTDLAKAGTALRTAADASLTWQWIAYSGIGGGTFTHVTNGWVDNAWDTQRRRGVEATSRVAFG